MKNHNAGEHTQKKSVNIEIAEKKERKKQYLKMCRAKKMALARFAIGYMGKDYFEGKKISFVAKLIKKNRRYLYRFYFDDDVNFFEAQVLTQEEYKSLSCGLEHNLHFQDCIDNFYIIVDREQNRSVADDWRAFRMDAEVGYKEAVSKALDQIAQGNY